MRSDPRPVKPRSAPVRPQAHVVQTRLSLACAATVRSSAISASRAILCHISSGRRGSLAGVAASPEHCPRLAPAWCDRVAVRRQDATVDDAVVVDRAEPRRVSRPRPSPCRANAAAPAPLLRTFCNEARNLLVRGFSPIACCCMVRFRGPRGKGQGPGGRAAWQAQRSRSLANGKRTHLAQPSCDLCITGTGGCVTP